MITLADAVTADGNYPSAAGITTKGVRDLCAIGYGTFGGGTIKVQATVDGGTTWVDLASATLSAAGTFRLQIGEGWTIRAVLSGSTNPILTLKAS